MSVQLKQASGAEFIVNILRRCNYFLTRNHGNQGKRSIYISWYIKSIMVYLGLDKINSINEQKTLQRPSKGSQWSGVYY